MDLGRVHLVQSKSTSVQIHTVNSSMLTLVLSEQGGSLFRARGVDFVSYRGNAFIANTTHGGDGIFQAPDPDTRYLVQLSPQTLLEQLQTPRRASLRELSVPLRIELSTRPASAFRSALSFIWQQRGPTTALLRAAHDEVLLQGLVSLLGPFLCHDDSTALPDLGPAYVRRASEVIRALVMEPVRIAEVAHELGISPRHLQSGFRQHLGTTPQKFLRDCRLDHAHGRLSTARPGDTVTSIAYDCGFVHLGDFARNYRMRFGESPSETLGRARI